MSDYPEFTPTTDEIRERWMNFDSEPDATDAAEFDRWLQKVQADAWDEAKKSAHLVDTVNVTYISHGENPYL